VLLCSYEPYYNDSYAAYKAVLMTREQLESSIKTDTPQEMKNPGKIYLKDHFIFIIEKYKGVHIVDNSDRLNPIKKGFIHIPGIVDVAVKGDVLYADNAVDLVALDIHKFPEVVLTQRIKDTFSELSPPESDDIPYEYTKDQRPDNTIIVAWEKK
jgi:pyrrolidone-carboxylate peptidase